jgi:hypothetical protein
MKRLLVVVMLITAGCATAGRQIETVTTPRIQRGVTTREEVISLLGPPLNAAKLADGRETLRYGYANASGSLSYVVTIGPNGTVEKTIINGSDSKP